MFQSIYFCTSSDKHHGPGGRSDFFVFKLFGVFSSHFGKSDKHHQVVLIAVLSEISFTANSAKTALHMDDFMAISTIITDHRNPAVLKYMGVFGCNKHHFGMDNATGCQQVSPSGRWAHHGSRPLGRIVNPKLL